MLTVEDLHKAAEFVGTDDDGSQIEQVGLSREAVVEFAFSSHFSLTSGEDAEVDPLSLALGIAIGVTAANGVPEVLA